MNTNKITLPQLIDQLKAQGCKVRDEVPNNDFGDLYITPNGELKCARELWRIQGENKQTYRILDVGEKLQEGDEVHMMVDGKLEWQAACKGIFGCTVSSHPAYMPHGYYRRPVTASSDNHAEHVQAHLTLAIKEQEAEIKKLKSDLFAYGEFTTNVAKALGMYIMEISFKEVLEEIANLKKSRLMCGCSELIREITKRENTSPEVKNWEQVAKAFENEVARQADYIEGLERDLRSESGWKDLLAIRDKRIEDLVELCHKESASAEEAWQKAEVFEDCLNQIAVILGPKTTISDCGFTDGEPTCHRVVEVLTERILRLWKLEAANDHRDAPL